ncbi:MAG: glycosyltransferase [Bacteroidota bacterium]
MKHLLLLTPGFAADEQDSRCIPPLQLFVQQLQEQGRVKVSLISLHYPFKREAAQWRGVDVYSCYSQGPFSRLRIWWQAYRWMKKIHREEPIHLIHSFWLTDAAWLGQRMSRRLNVPHWITLMGQDVRPSNRYLRLLPPAKVNTIALSPFHHQRLLKTTSQPAKALIPWGIAAADCPAPKATKTIDLLGVGNLIGLKDYATFIRLLDRLREQHPHLRACIVGDGPLRTSLQQQAKAADLEEHLQFTGYLPRAKVLDLMAQSRVLLHPSTFESFGYIFLEALACGMSVVSRPVGIAEAGSRWRLADDEQGLYTALLEALAEAPHQDPVFPHPIEATMQAYHELYDQSINISR